MGYSVEAFICKQADGHVMTDHFDKAVRVDISQGICLIPMTEDLFDQINKFQISQAILDSQFLTENVEHEILKVVGERQFAYVEALYHGGQGGQIAIIWKDNKRSHLLEYGPDKINYVLKYFGAVAHDGADEFLTLGFGLRRKTSDWLQEQS